MQRFSSAPKLVLPEHVYVENEWYDGPRAGIADVQGQPHRFKSQFDEKEDEYLGTFVVWPINAEEMALEKEQWAIFVDWNDDYERGIAIVDTHPGHPGINTRWDELQKLLKKSRDYIPTNAKNAKAEMVQIARKSRYLVSGPAYLLRWSLI